VSSRIRVRSIVGRFLEHSRIYFFENGNNPEVYLGSADWMPRNLYERVEVIFPLKDSALCERICTEILTSYLADTRKARVLSADGCYARPQPTRDRYRFSVQDYLMGIAAGAGDDGRTSAHKSPAVVYTPMPVAPPSVASPHEPATEDSENAAV
jgi:polyphosphate kinase